MKPTLTVLIMFMLALPGCGGSAEEHRSGWQFDLTRTVGKESHLIRQILRGNKESLQDPDFVNPILRKFLKKMVSGDVLEVGAHTGGLNTGATWFLLDVKLVAGEYILVPRTSVYRGAVPRSITEIEDHMSSVLANGVSIMADWETRYDEWGNRLIVSEGTARPSHTRRIGRRTKGTRRGGSKHGQRIRAWRRPCRT